MKVPRWIEWVVVALLAAAAFSFLVRGHDDDVERAHAERVRDAMRRHAQLYRWLDSLHATEGKLAASDRRYREAAKAVSRIVDSLERDRVQVAEYVHVAPIDTVAASIGLRLVAAGLWGTDSAGVRALAVRVADGDSWKAQAVELARGVALYRDSIVPGLDVRVALLVTANDSLRVAALGGDSLLAEDLAIHRPGCHWGFVRVPCISPVTAAGIGVVVGGVVVLGVVGRPHAERSFPTGFERAMFDRGPGDDHQYLEVPAVTATP